MDLASWLHYLESFPSGLNNRSLINVRNVAARLGVLTFHGKIIIVGGTNGKSSSVIFLETILFAVGYKTGAYISPHLFRYNERIRLNGKDVDDEFLCRIFTQVEKYRADVSLSYFEFSTLAALLLFKEQMVDVLILEVGLGGRFDAVNILDADIAIITSVSFDHTKILGHTLEAIGREKSGIMRPLKPIIYGSASMPKSVYAAAKQTKAVLYCVNKDFFYGQHQDKWWWRSENLEFNNLPVPRLPLADAATVLMAVALLRQEFSITKKAIITGIKKAFLPGRWQRLLINNKRVIFDVAHNPEAAALLAQNLIRLKPHGRILAVMSMLGDKDITATLRELTKLVDKWYIGLLAGARAANADQLSQSLLMAGGVNFVVLPDISLALQQAIAECERKDKIVVFGSFRTVAAGLKIVVNKQLEIKI